MKSTCWGYRGLIGVDWGTAGNGGIPGPGWGLVDKLFGELNDMFAPGGPGYKLCIWGVKGGPLSLELFTFEKTPGDGLAPIFCSPRDEFEGPTENKSYSLLCCTCFSKYAWINYETAERLIYRINK